MRELSEEEEKEIKLVEDAKNILSTKGPKWLSGEEFKMFTIFTLAQCMRKIEILEQEIKELKNSEG